ncbi:ATP-binding protein [Salmonella enterica]|nr:ATP-binding protein [Salmonella enterica subsp. enterica serovar Chicago]EKR4495462.1 ATP-binding protein [Salmonella enterica]
MKISVNIQKLQHISNVSVFFDFSDYPLICMTSKNGIGKTSIIKSLALLNDAAIISKTSSIFSINEETKIEITIDEQKFTFESYNNELDTKDILRDDSLLNVELPIPYGRRFSEFPSLGTIDRELRELYLKGEYSSAIDLIEFLNKIYDTSKFQDLKEVIIKGKKYYFIPLENNKYIREDYFSSGEFFVISIFKMITSNSKLIIIDEIDVSLDASAQVSLMGAVRDICEINNKKVLFTTHSLAIMRTIYSTGNPIVYLKNVDNQIISSNVSYSFVQLEMFGFKGYDKYILTEDITLEKYINYKLSSLETDNMVKVIYIGGCAQVIDILKRNSTYHFICPPENAIAILDGDARVKYGNINNVLISPFDDIEDEIFRKYNEENDKYSLPDVAPSNAKSKVYWKKLLESKETYGITFPDIVNILETGFEKEAACFTEYINSFINS